MDSNNKTKLKDRELWFDGDSTVSEHDLIRLIARGGSVDGMFVDQISQDIQQYNQLVPKKERISIKNSMFELSLGWNIPKQYLDIDVKQYVLDKFYEDVDLFSFDEAQQRGVRILSELLLYKSLGLMDVLRTLIFVINKLKDNDVVWGVGRGSSVASYVLYLIGVHDVDSVQYDLEITEFLR